MGNTSTPLAGQKKMDKKIRGKAATVLVLCDHCVSLNPVTLEKKKKKHQFQITTTERAVEEPRAKQGLCKTEIKYKYVWVDKQGGRKREGRGNEPRKQPQTWSNHCVWTL